MYICDKVMELLFLNEYNVNIKAGTNGQSVVSALLALSKTKVRNIVI